MENQISLREIWDIRLRAVFGFGLIVLFFLLNIAVLWMVYRLMETDRELLEAGTVESGDRVVSSKVLISLIGATVVQVGAAAVAITRYLFPSSKT